MRASILSPSRADVAITAVVTVMTVTPVLVPYRQPWWAVALAVLMSVPVLWRRRAVLPVGAVVGCATTVLAIAVEPLPHSGALVLLLPYGVLVCTYTFAAADLSRARRAGGVAGLAAGVAVSLVVPQENLETYRYLLTAIVAAYALGVSARARRAGREAEREREARVREERAAAVARERTRIARDMHDIVTHSVGLMVIQAETGPLVARDHPEKAEAVFEAIAAAGRDAIGQLRLILGALRGSEGLGGPAPALGPQPGLDALPGLLDNARRAGLDVSADVRGEPRRLPSDVDVAAYRIVQEALTNTIRHAGASTVRVRVRWSGDTLEVEVADDGRGGRELQEGHGMIGMRERVTACGGRLAVRPGNPGLTVAATLPIG
ncbi:sensor histidine kinase [Microbispora triticiradicis]|uniref:histidine kinase n=1 Tax=Microbispora triticiradicis TaxID=2200763 RepID=A0ABX9LRJ2_9ACTN|nr:sensor histidine kinase [Microbispora triticiradicis]RGA06642.1 sensor histidine kinase [Microbispora triticiradicis]GLW20955.1 two-component sensor histidine kinase [Microbispora amethystogenes]